MDSKDKRSCLKLSTGLPHSQGGKGEVMVGRSSILQTQKDISHYHQHTLPPTLNFEGSFSRGTCKFYAHTTSA